MKGLMKLYATTFEESLSCIIPDIEVSQEITWPFAFNWGVILDQVLVYHQSRFDDQVIVTWISKHFRAVRFAARDSVTESTFHDMLVDAGSNIQHLDGLTLDAKSIVCLSKMLQRLQKIKTLRVHLAEDIAQTQKDAFIREVCECKTVSNIGVSYCGFISSQILSRSVLSLIRCGHFEDIRCKAFSTCDFPKISRDEQEKHKTDRTRSFLDAIAASTQLMGLNCVNYPYAGEFIHNDSVKSVLAVRRNRVAIERMSHLVEQDNPIRMALFGVSVPTR